MSRVGVLEGALPPGENTRLFGHDEALAFLGKAYYSGRIHHAVLIEGPEGIGKATLAFRFAHHILTHPDQTLAPAIIGDPDPGSSVYRQIASGASHHLLHLTRPVDEKTGRVKSAITIDEVRRAGRLFSQTSGTGGWRIVIVDPADDLNRSAANAILKMLEEPPKRSLFLVVSHAPGRLLPTIRSRCLALRLAPLAPRPLVAALDHLPAGRAMKPEARARVAECAEGSVGRALMMINYGGLDILDAFESIVERGPERSHKAAHALADMLTTKDREEAFHFFCDHLQNWVATRARQAAMRGDIERAATYAAFGEGLATDLATAQAYNLDRKQTLLSTFSSLLAVEAA